MGPKKGCYKMALHCHLQVIAGVLGYGCTYMNEIWLGCVIFQTV